MALMGQNTDGLQILNIIEDVARIKNIRTKEIKKVELWPLLVAGIGAVILIIVIIIIMWKVNII